MDVIVMDFSKAFDFQVPHNGLLYKLLKCGIDDVTLQWLKGFLEKRRHGVVLETVNTSKYVGTYLSHDLRWNDHVN